MVRVSTKIKRLLVDAGIVTTEEWAGARGSGPNVVDTLISEGVVEENALMDVLGRASGVPPVDLTMVTPDPAAITSMPKETCQEWGILPLTRNGNVLTIAVSDPFDVLLFDDLKRMTGCHVRTVFAHGAMLKQAFAAVYENSSQAVADIIADVDDSGFNVEQIEESADIEAAAGTDDAPAVKLINVILLKALRAKVSDIHVEPGDKIIRVRFRIDGQMQIVMTPPRTMLNSLISRLKILASLDIAERFTPQDGKFQTRYEGRSIDFRLSILPVVGGEKAVLRILDAGSLALKLETMGYEDRSHEDILSAIAAPHGMMLVTGPTGSGKSTTLYSCVQHVANETVNVVTVEDPVEYRMDGINQVPVNPKRGLTFAGALRSILRQDPDIVLVGEIRDKETADIAIKAALTGHLVLSTLHTNDAASTITRLIDMGIDPFMVSSSLLTVCAQRLGRRLCKHCRSEIDRIPPREKLLAVGFEEADFNDLKLYEASVAGCNRCSGGFRGRFPILETLPLSPKIRRLIVEGRSSDEIKVVALEEGMLTLRRVGILNAIRGVTSLEEVLRITTED
jgi:type IV pilus assembly protein PilB